MLHRPPIIIDHLNPFAPCFYGVTTWAKAQVLLIGAILTPGKRVVTEALRVMGLQFNLINGKGFVRTDSSLLPDANTINRPFPRLWARFNATAARA